MATTAVMATEPKVRATVATSLNMPKSRAIVMAPVRAPRIVRAMSRETMMLALARSAIAPTTRLQAPISVTTACAIRVNGG